MIRIVNVRDCPEWIESAADYFSTRWNIERQLYHDSMNESVTTVESVPRWYLLLRGEEIIGGFGLIDNDFMVRTDLCPWLCALYIEPSMRGQQLGAKLLAHSRREAAKLGFDKVFLNTDHVGYYEKYDWQYIGDFPHQNGVDTRVYEADAIQELEEMSAFFDARAEIYDSYMLDNLGLDEFYEVIFDCFEEPVKRLLGLGCGTGLEFERLFERFPDMEVTGIDLSQEMLNKFADKYPGKKLRLICGSYFDEDFGGLYDHVLSTYSLHHFSEESKLELYKKIYDTIEPGGIFVFGDYTVSTMEHQNELIAENDRKRCELGITDNEIYHFDTPFTPETEIRLMKGAGFPSTEIVRQWENTTIIIARK
jgi:SAM-dependent methyltransferase